MAIDLSDDLVKAFASPEVKSVLKTLLREMLDEAGALRTANDDGFIDTKGAAEYLDRSEAAIRKMVERGTIPHAHIGGPSGLPPRRTPRARQEVAHVRKPFSKARPLPSTVG